MKGDGAGLTYTTVLVSDDVSCPQVLENRSYAIDSSIPASLVHISNTYPMLGVPSSEAGGVPRGWGTDMAESGWWVE